MVVDDIDRSGGENPFGIESISDEEGDLLSVWGFEFCFESTVGRSGFEIISTEVVEHGGDIGSESRGIVLFRTECQSGNQDAME